jgi:hypothetical protein
MCLFLVVVYLESVVSFAVFVISAVAWKAICL